LEAHFAAFDAGYVERHDVRDEAGVGETLRIGDQVDKLRFAYAPFTQIVDACSVRGGPCLDSSASPGRFAM